MTRIYIDYLIDIKTETERIQKFIDGISFQDFLENDEKIYAVCRSFEIIGEAVNRIPNNTLKLYQDVNWKDMAQMRDRLIHYYYGVDEKILWDTAKYDIPVLHEQILEVIEKEKIV